MTAPASVPPQLSPDGQWWWDGAQWIPAAQAPPPPPTFAAQPPQAPLAAPVPSGHDGKAVASLVLGILWLGGLGSIVAVVLGHLSRSASRKQGRPASGLALAGLILGYLGAASLALILALLIAGAAVFSSQQHASQSAAVKIDLRRAALAEEAFMTDNSTGYTTSLSDLDQEGFTPSDGVDVSIVSADASGYCLTGSLTDGGSTYYYDSTAGGFTSQPCS